MSVDGCQSLSPTGEVTLDKLHFRVASLSLSSTYDLVGSIGVPIRYDDVAKSEIT